jgi:hypothetical protein
MLTQSPAPATTGFTVVGGRLTSDSPLGPPPPGLPERPTLHGHLVQLLGGPVTGGHMEYLGHDGKPVTVTDLPRLLTLLETPWQWDNPFLYLLRRLSVDGGHSRVVLVRVAGQRPKFARQAGSRPDETY